MATESETFEVSGPFRLTHIDWSDQQHRRTAAASLVKGVKNLELDHQRKNRGPHQDLRRWWESFDFELKQKVKDKRDSSYFGAIYEHRSAPSSNSSPGQNPPRYVIAFRGTSIKWKNLKRDLESNVHIFCHKLHEDYRYPLAWRTALKFVDEAGPENVWLAGHSLGSAIALLVGRNMVTEKGFYLETYLFNPPFPSLTIEPFIKGEKKKDAIRTATSFGTAAVAAMLGSLSLNPQQENSFTALAKWTPYLFLHPSDPICSGYIGYFKQRGKMESIGTGKIGKLATRNSARTVLYGAILGKKREPIHLLPSARLFINLSTAQGLEAHRPKQWCEAHRLKQWYERDIDCEDLSYEYE